MAILEGPFRTKPLAHHAPLLDDRSFRFKKIAGTEGIALIVTGATGYILRPVSPLVLIYCLVFFLLYRKVLGRLFG